MDRTLVFTDLGGTLLDEHSYSWAPAAAAVDMLDRNGIPLVLVSSRTLPEMRRLRRAMNNTHPFVVENGGACVIPRGYFDVADAGVKAEEEQVELQGPSWKNIRRTLVKLRESDTGFRFCGCGDLSPEQLSERTGLSPEAARLASERLCSEPLFWEGDSRSLARFEQALAKQGLRLLRGARLLHVLGSGDRASSVEMLRERYRCAWSGAQWFSVALGSHSADEAMLRAADMAVVLPGADGSMLELAGHPAVLYARTPGPKGWHEAVEQILQRLG